MTIIYFSALIGHKSNDFISTKNLKEFDYKIQKILSKSNDLSNIINEKDKEINQLQNELVESIKEKIKIKRIKKRSKSVKFSDLTPLPDLDFPKMDAYIENTSNKEMKQLNKKIKIN